MAVRAALLGLILLGCVVPAVAQDDPVATIVMSPPGERLLVRIQPLFPEDARRAGVRSGSCAMTFTIRADGGVDEHSVAADCSHEALVDAAMQAVAGWKYAPSIVDGRVVERPGTTASIAFTDADPAAGE